MSHGHHHVDPSNPYELPDPEYKCKYHLDPKAKSPHIHLPPTPVKKIYNNVLEAMTTTPIIKLNNIPKEEGLECELLVKCEFMTPGGSLKDRVGYRMVYDAQTRGEIKPGDTLVEPTSGNTGIGMALAAVVYGYKAIFCLPEKMSFEKTELLSALGAEIVRRPTELDHDHPDSYVGAAKKLAKLPNHHFLDQYSNASNAVAHYDATSLEILEQCDGKVDYLFISAGTGGALTGLGRRFKERLPTCKIVAIDPVGSLQALPGSLNGPSGSYKVEGAGHDYIPLCMDRKVADYWVKTDDKESLTYARKLIKQEGLFGGGTTGSVLFGAIKFAKEHKLPATARCVLVAPDGIRNYMTKFISESWMIDNGFYSTDLYKDPNHLLAGVPSSKIDLKPIKIYDESLTIAQALNELIQGAPVIPFANKEGAVFKVLTHTTINTALGNKSSQPTEEAVWIAKKDFTMHDVSLDINQLEKALRRSPFVLLKESDAAGKVTKLFYVTAEDISKITKAKLGL